MLHSKLEYLYMYCWFWSTACCGEYLITSARCKRRPPQPGRCLFQFHVTGRDIFRVVEKLKSAWWASHAQSLKVMARELVNLVVTEAGRMRKVGSTSTCIVHHTIQQCYGRTRVLLMCRMERKPSVRKCAYILSCDSTLPCFSGCIVLHLSRFPSRFPGFESLWTCYV